MLPLLSSGNEALLYFVRRDLLGENVGSVHRLWQLPEVQKILKKQLSGWDLAPDRREKTSSYQLSSHRNMAPVQVLGRAVRIHARASTGASSSRVPFLMPNGQGGGRPPPCHSQTRREPLRLRSGQRSRRGSEGRVVRCCPYRFPARYHRAEWKGGGSRPIFRVKIFAWRLHK